MKIIRVCILIYLFGLGLAAHSQAKSQDEPNKVFFNGQCCDLTLSVPQIKNGKVSVKIPLDKDIKAYVSGFTIRIKGREFKVKGDRITKDVNLALDRLRLGDFITISDVKILTVPETTMLICKVSPILIKIR